jgi:hypothetical protein
MVCGEAAVTVAGLQARGGGEGSALIFLAGYDPVRVTRADRMRLHNPAFYRCGVWPGAGDAQDRSPDDLWLCPAIHRGVIHAHFLERRIYPARIGSVFVSPNQFARSG